MRPLDSARAGRGLDIFCVIRFSVLRQCLLCCRSIPGVPRLLGVAGFRLALFRSRPDQSAPRRLWLSSDWSRFRFQPALRWFLFWLVGSVVGACRAAASSLHKRDVGDLRLIAELLHRDPHAPIPWLLFGGTKIRGLDRNRDQHLGFVTGLRFQARLSDGSHRLRLRLFDALRRKVSTAWKSRRRTSRSPSPEFVGRRCRRAASRSSSNSRALSTDLNQQLALLLRLLCLIVSQSQPSDQRGQATSMTTPNTVASRTVDIDVLSAARLWSRPRHRSRLRRRSPRRPRPALPPLRHSSLLRRPH